jgi:hypothetical protein
MNPVDLLNEFGIGSVQRVQIDSSCLDIGMTEQFLDRANVRPGLPQMNRDTVPKVMAADVLVHPSSV